MKLQPALHLPLLKILQLYTSHLLSVTLADSLNARPCMLVVILYLPYFSSYCAIRLKVFLYFFVFVFYVLLIFV